MTKRHILVLGALGVALLALVAEMSTDAKLSLLEKLSFGVLAICMLILAAWQVLTAASVDGRRGLPRIFWVGFASLAVAVVVLVLIAAAAFPFMGVRSFELLSGAWSGLCLVVLAVVAFPLVNRYLS